MPGGEIQPHDANAEVGRRIADALRGLVSSVPDSREPTTLNPRKRAEHLAEMAAWKTAAISGTLAIVPGPLGILTIIPALMEIWSVQRQLVSDIAACYGQTSSLSPTVMVYCLFRHGSATVFKETVIQVGGRLLVREASLFFFQTMIEKLSVNITQRLIGQFISRWLPLVGSAAIGAYSYRDTKKVAASAIDAFEKEIEAEVVSVEVLPPPFHPPPFPGGSRSGASGGPGPRQL